MTISFNVPRLESYLARTTLQLQTRIAEGATTQAKIDALAESLDVDISELSAFQQLKNRAYMAGKLSLDEAQQIYLWLGESPDHFNRQPVEVKILVTNLMGELLKMRI
jgi:hypothetical protein